jgi:membrane-bound lytic murein transglycosylase D
MGRLHLDCWPRIFLALLPLTVACATRASVPVSVPLGPSSVQTTEVAPAPDLDESDPAEGLFSGSGADFQVGDFRGGKEELDRLGTFEVEALAAGDDGFTEKPSEAASIDELLSLTPSLDHPAPAGLEDIVSHDLQAAEPDIPIPLNQRVLSYVELFQGRLRDFIEEGLTRGTKYLPMIQSVLRAEGLPLDLAYVPLIESAFKPTALSRAKAKGVWQFVRRTALANGLRHDWYVDERSDPEKATVAAARYLASLVKLFDGDWHLALASYNGGPTRVQRAVRTTGRADFWKLTERSPVLPRETREYVPMILAAIVVARNPAQYGFAVEPEEPLAYEIVVLSHAVDLRRAAEWAGVTIDELQALNPELRRWTTPVWDERYELKVPVGTADRIRERLEESSSAELTSLKWYTVKRGETLLGIARKLRVSRADLAEANRLARNARVRVGQKLIVPREAATLMAARTERPAPVADARPPVAAAGEPARPAGASGQVWTTYEVQRGDTLWSIARLFETTTASLRAWNPRIVGDRLFAGDSLTVNASLGH